MGLGRERQPYFISTTQIVSHFLKLCKGELLLGRCKQTPPPLEQRKDLSSHLVPTNLSHLIFTHWAAAEDRVEGFDCGIHRAVIFSHPQEAEQKSRPSDIVQADSCRACLEHSDPCKEGQKTTLCSIGRACCDHHQWGQSKGRRD